MSTITYIPSDMTQAMNHWHYIEPYAKVPATKKEYRKQCLLLDKLMEQTMQKHDRHIANLLELIARNLNV